MWRTFKGTRNCCGAVQQFARVMLIAILHHSLERGVAFGFD
jgi:hypothetical protein